MKHLALDIGNVICHVDFDKILNVLSKSLNISKVEALYFLNRTQKLHDLGLTNLSDELHDHFKIKSEVIIKDILDEWNRSIQIDNDVIREVEKLRNTYDLEIALVSNIGVEHAEHFRKNCGLGNVIEFFSCEVGARKPNLLYYQSFLSMYPQFKECIYLDDLDANLAIGTKFGLKAIKFVLSDYKKAPYDSMLVGGSKLVSFFQDLEKHFKSSE